jgi:hypothetical protein
MAEESLFGNRAMLKRDSSREDALQSVRFANEISAAAGNNTRMLREQTVIFTSSIQHNSFPPPAIRRYLPDFQFSFLPVCSLFS